MAWQSMAYYLRWVRIALLAMEWQQVSLKHIQPRLDVKTSVLVIDRDLQLGPR
jgi:hypothetical protein